LPMPQTFVEPDTKAAAAQRAPVAPIDAQSANEPRKVVTSRWPEPAAVSPPAAAPAPPAPVGQAQPQAPQIQPQAQAPAQAQAAPVAPPPRPAAPAPLAKANAADQPLSLPMLLTVLVGGLSVIGVMVSAVFARVQSRRDKSRPGRRLSKSAPMQPVQAPEQPLPETARPERRLSEQQSPEELRSADDPTRRLQPRRDKSRPSRRLSKSAPMPPMPPLQTPEQSLPETALPEKQLSEQQPPDDPRAPDDPTRRLQQMLAEIQRRAAA
jgi:hypothetical protein